MNPFSISASSPRHSPFSKETFRGLKPIVSDPSVRKIRSLPDLRHMPDEDYENYKKERSALSDNLRGIPFVACDKASDMANRLFLENEIRRLQCDLFDAHASLKAAEARDEYKFFKVRSLDEKLISNKHELEVTKTELGVEREEKRVLTEKLEGTVKDLTEKVGLKSRQVSDLQYQVNKLAGALETRTQRNEEFESELKTLQARNNRLLDELSTLKEQVAGGNQKTKNQGIELARLLRKDKEMQQKLATTERRSINLERANTLQKEARKRLVLDMVQLRQEVETGKKEVADAQKDIKNLSQELEGFHDLGEENPKKNHVLMQELARMNNDVGEKTAETEDLQKQLAQQEEEIAEARRQVGTAKDQADQVKKDYKLVSGINALLSQKNRDLSTRDTELKQQLQEQRALADLANRQVEQLTLVLDAMEENLREQKDPDQMKSNVIAYRDIFEAMKMGVKKGQLTLWEDMKQNIVKTKEEIASHFSSIGMLPPNI